MVFWCMALFFTILFLLFISFVSFIFLPFVVDFPGLIENSSLS